MGTPTVLTDVRIFAGGADLTSYSNMLELASEFETKDVTTFASSGNREVKAGLGSTAFTAAGHWEAGDTSKVDNAIWAGIGGTDAWTATAEGASVGDVAYVIKALEREYKLLGQVGDVAPWSASGSGTWPTARGAILHPPGTARTATGNGTAVQQGAITAGQYGYAALHVYSISGTDTPTITVKVQSDDNSGFSSATDRITFTAATATGGQISRVAGAITDDYWRATWTISGTNPSFLFVVSFGIK